MAPPTGRGVARPPRSVFAAAAALAVTVVMVFSGSTAGAHGGAGTIEVVSQEQTGPTQLTVQAEIRFVLDDHPATPASFTVTGLAADGAQAGPVDLTATGTEGLYEGVVDVPTPGAWTLTFASTLPPSEKVEEVTVEDLTAPSSEAPPTTLVGDGELIDPTDADETASTESVDTSPPTALLAGLVVSGLLVVAVIVGVVWYRRRSPAG